jgi:hypothetical protein
MKQLMPMFLVLASMQSVPRRVPPIIAQDARAILYLRIEGAKDGIDNAGRGLIVTQDMKGGLSASKLPSAQSSSCVIPPSPLPSPNSAYEALFKQHQNELDLSKLGVEAFAKGDYLWAIRFLEQAQSMKSSRTENSPYLAAARLLANKDHKAFECTLQDMLAAMREPGYLHHDQTIGFAVNHLTDVSHYLDSEAQNYIDNVVLPEILRIVSAGCGDERDQMAMEYVSYGVPLRPQCTDFVDIDAGESHYFSLADFNVACPSQKPAKYQWVLLRSPLLEGVDPWVENYKAIITSKYKQPFRSRIINSAYRVPSQNKACGGVSNSRHMYGDAADMRNITRTTAEWKAMREAAEGNASWIEPLSGPCRLGCVHADWRDK